MATLNDLDQQLLTALRENGRAPVAELARTLGVSRATVTSRLDRLTGAGTIVGFSVRIRDDSDSDSVRAVSLIEVEGRSTDNVIRKLRSFTEIEALHSTNGAWDLVAEIRADSLADFDRFLGRLRSIHGVLNSETSLLLSSVIR